MKFQELISKLLERGLILGGGSMVVGDEGLGNISEKSIKEMI